MPAFAADDHGKIAVGVEEFFDFCEGGEEDLLFEVFAFDVAGIEFAGEVAGFGRVGGEEQAQGGFGGVEASGGVEAWAEAEADFGGCDGRNDGGDLHKGAQAFPFCLAEAG